LNSTALRGDIEFVLQSRGPLYRRRGTGLAPQTIALGLAARVHVSWSDLYLVMTTDRQGQSLTAEQKRLRQNRRDAGREAMAHGCDACRTKPGGQGYAHRSWNAWAPSVDHCGDNAGITAGQDVLDKMEMSDFRKDRRRPF